MWDLNRHYVASWTLRVCCWLGLFFVYKFEYIQQARSTISRYQLSDGKAYEEIS